VNIDLTGLGPFIDYVQGIYMIRHLVIWEGTNLNDCEISRYVARTTIFGKYKQ